MKKLISSLFCTLLTFGLIFADQTAQQKTIYLPENYSQETVNQAECKMFWDIHKTLVKRNKKEFLKPLAEHATFIATQLIYYGYEKINYAITGNKGPLLKLMEKKEQLKKEDCSGEGYYELFKSYDQRLADLTEKMANAYKPIAGMPELVSKITCEQLYASNIGKRFFANLQRKELDIHFPAIAGGQLISFDKKQIDATFDQENKLATVSYQTQKPNIQFFKNIRRQFNANQKSNFVFVDDKIENVIAAQKEGFIGIHFKNPEQVRADLQAIGLIQ